MKVNIIPVTSGDDLTSIGILFEEYQSSLGVDLGFQAFEQELEELPGDYVPPLGCLWLAKQGDSPAGCVALRPIDKQICEMKRLFVRPEYRALGLGRYAGQSGHHQSNRDWLRCNFTLTHYQRWLEHK